MLVERGASSESFRAEKEVIKSWSLLPLMAASTNMNLESCCNPSIEKRAMQALERARALNRSHIDFGVYRIYNHVRDVDGDWLENWSEGVSVSFNPEV